MATSPPGTQARPHHPPVPVHAKGAGSKQLAKRAVAGDPVRGKYLDNTDLANVLLQDLWANCSQAMGKRR
ncbi:hypothetical protein EDD41_1439 [Luteococcus japonicus]|uniref:Uncharacterized protein n=1 Tax=Luteococcus japonicus TaxID=33984 RepID=A0A3N1ZVP5_9ACTN|nr:MULTISPECIES: hypothetical protein [Luteococcus]MDN5564712.1 hypothetical protein [Luteococcus sp.]ROR54242.1 hypothetical protein EDD41_1439 [Luteococcus japonicus]